MLYRPYTAFDVAGKAFFLPSPAIALQTLQALVTNLEIFRIQQGS